MGKFREWVKNRWGVGQRKPLEEAGIAYVRVENRHLWFVGEGGEQKVYPFEEIVLIRGYKRDCFTIDCIFYEITFADGGSATFHEDMNHWKEAYEALSREFPDMKSKWAEVAYPAFEECLTVLYERGPEDQGD